MPGVSGISPHLPFPYLTLLTPIEIWGITSRPQALQSCPALTLPDVPCWAGGIYLQPQEFKEVLHHFIRKQLLCNLQVSRPFSWSSCSPSWATRAVNWIHHFVGNWKSLYNLQSAILLSRGQQRPQVQFHRNSQLSLQIHQQQIQNMNSPCVLLKQRAKQWYTN